MSKRSISLRLINCLILSSVIVIKGAAAPQLPVEGQTAALVDLKCTLIAGPAEPRKSVWLIELRNAAGQPLRQALRMVGSTVHFKNLLPGIYRIYLSGKGGRKSAESIDLTPSQDKKSVSFAKVVRVPEAAAQASAQYLVSVASLAVPKDAVEELKAADKSGREGDSSAVLRHLQKAIEIYPNYADAWNNLGSYYHTKGDYEQARQAFTKVTQLRPEFYVGWMNLGGSLLCMGKFAEGLEANKAALRLGPNDAVANSQVGLSYYYLHDYAAAKQYFRRVCDLDPALATSPQLYLAHIAMGEKQFDEAKAYLRSFLQYHPNSPDAADVQRTLDALSEGTAGASAQIRK